jgi:hypothetical protein
VGGFHVDCNVPIALARGPLDVFAVEDEVILVDASTLEDGHGRE